MPVHTKIQNIFYAYYYTCPYNLMSPGEAIFLHFIMCLCTGVALFYSYNILGKIGGSLIKIHDVRMYLDLMLQRKNSGVL